MDDTPAVLQHLPMLASLPHDTKKLVLDSFVPVTYGFGTPIVREGEEAEAWYVLVSGRARVVKQASDGTEMTLGVLRSGDSFGEMGLLACGTRTATVRASSEVQVLKLDKSLFQAILRTHAEIRTSFELQSARRSLHNFLRLYTPFAQLSAVDLDLLLAELETVSVAQGTLVIRQGTAPGPLYVVEEGRLRVFTEDHGQHCSLAYLRQGDVFGEMSVFTGSKRTASVEAVSPCTLLQLRPESFARLLEASPEFKEQIAARIARYDYQHVARMPLDFAPELLPAQSTEPAQGSPAIVEQPEAGAMASTLAATSPFATPDGLFVKRRKKIRRFPYVRQIDAMDCGAACLAMVCRHFGRSVSLARIRRLVQVSTDGISLKALCHGATALGLAARMVKATPRDLLHMPVPAIVHWQGNHWVVVYDVDATQVRFADPALGLRCLHREVFEQHWTGYAALFDYTIAFDHAPEGTPSLRWLWSFVRPFTPYILEALALSVLVSLLQMLLPVCTQLIVDRVLVEHDVGLLHTLILVMGGVVVFMLLATGVQRYLLSFAAVRLDAAILDFLTRRLLALPMSYFNARRTGDIQRRLTSMRQVREFLVHHGLSGLTAAVQLGAALSLMTLYSAYLTLVFLATAPLYALLMHFSARWLRPIFATLEEAFGTYHSRQIDAIKGIETVKALGAEDGLRQMLLQQYHGIASHVVRTDRTLMGYQGSIRAVTFLSMALFLWVGAQQVMQGSFTIGALVAFNSLVALANGPITVLLGLWDRLQLVSVLLNHLADIFDQEPEQGTDHTRLLPVRTLEGRITLQHLSFQYGGAESPKILDDITLEVPAGHTVAIVGRSGSGKTTLSKCLAGLLEPTAGSILYDGIDLKTLNYRDLRRQIGFVLQDNYLFDDTIARNIAFGEDEPDMDRVWWAARLANAHTFVEQLPLGYDTRVGETGIALSGGQRQRLAIARALYHQPAVLIFDEATSALDTESERSVQTSMAQVLQGHTTFVIAHRLSTIRDADLILVLDSGRLVEHGTHDALMQCQGLYYYLCRQQLEL